MATDRPNDSARSRGNEMVRALQGALDDAPRPTAELATRAGVATHMAASYLTLLRRRGEAASKRSANGRLVWWRTNRECD
jgi:hypothetical protein